MMIVRENTEGEYSSIGGRMYEGTAREILMQQTVMSRIGVDRVLEFAFELARTLVATGDAWFAQRRRLRVGAPLVKGRKHAVARNEWQRLRIESASALDSEWARGCNQSRCRASRSCSPNTSRIHPVRFLF